MNTTFLRVAMPALLLVGLSAGAATLYVDVNSTNPVPPYTNWATAASVIQDAVDAARFWGRGVGDGQAPQAVGIGERVDASHHRL